MRHEMHEMPVKLNDETIDCPTELRGTRGNRIEGRLDVRRRAADHAQNVARCRLLLEGLADLSVRLSERSVLLLQLGKEPHILDGDHRLVGKCRDQLDLLLGERLDLEPLQREDSEQAALSDHGNRQQGAEAE